MRNYTLEELYAHLNEDLLGSDILSMRVKEKERKKALEFYLKNGCITLEYFFNNKLQQEILPNNKNQYIVEEILSGNEKRDRIDCPTYNSESCTYLCINRNNLQYCDVQILSGNDPFFLENYKEQFRILFYLELNNCSFAQCIQWPLYRIEDQEENYQKFQYLIVNGCRIMSLKRMNFEYIQKLSLIYQIQYQDLLHNWMIELLKCIYLLHSHAIAHRNIKPCNLIYQLDLNCWLITHFEYSQFYNQIVDYYYIKGDDKYIPAELVKIRQNEENLLEPPKKYRQNLLANDLFGLYKSLEPIFRNYYPQNYFVQLIAKISTMDSLYQYIQQLQYYSGSNLNYQMIFENLYQQQAPLQTQRNVKFSQNFFDQMIHFSIPDNNYKIEDSEIIKRLLLFSRQYYLLDLSFKYSFNLLKLLYFSQKDRIILLSIYQNSIFFCQQVQDQELNQSLASENQILQILQPFQYALLYYNQAMQNYLIKNYQVAFHIFMEIYNYLSLQKQILRENQDFFYCVIDKIEELSKILTITSDIKFEDQKLKYYLQVFGIEQGTIFKCVQYLIQNDKFNLYQRNLIFPFLLLNYSFEDLQQLFHLILAKYPKIIYQKEIVGYIKQIEIAFIQFNEGFYQKALDNCDQTIFSSQDNQDVQKAFILKSKVLNKLGLANKAQQHLELVVSQYDTNGVSEQLYLIMLESFYLLQNKKIISECLSKLTFKQNPQIILFSKRRIENFFEFNINYSDDIEKVKVLRYMGYLQEAMQVCELGLERAFLKVGYLSNYTGVLLFEKSKLLMLSQKRSEAIKELISSQLIFINFWTFQVLFQLVILMSVFCSEKIKLNDLQLLKKYVGSMVGEIWAVELKFQKIAIKQQFKKLMRYAIRYYQQYLDQPYPLNDEFIDDLTLNNNEFKSIYQLKLNDRLQRKIFFSKIYEQIYRWISSWQ